MLRNFANLIDRCSPPFLTCSIDSVLDIDYPIKRFYFANFRVLSGFNLATKVYRISAASGFLLIQPLIGLNAPSIDLVAISV